MARAYAGCPSTLITRGRIPLVADNASRRNAFVPHLADRRRRYEEEDALSNAGLHQDIDLVDEREGLASAGRHSKKHRALPFRDGTFRRGVRLFLVLADERVIVRHAEELLAVGFEIAPHKFKERTGRMKAEYLAGSIQFVPDVVIPDDFAVCRMEKRNSEPTEVEGTRVDALGVAPPR